MVHLNGRKLYDVEPAVATFETEGPFAVELRNHGQAVHVHLRLDDELSRVASLDGTNHFVDTESVLSVPVDVAEGAPDVRGTLKVVTGYGSGTDEVEVLIADEDGGEPVAVGEDLSQPEPGSGGQATATPPDQRDGATARSLADGAGDAGGLADALSRVRAVAGTARRPELLGDVRRLAAVTVLVVVGIAVAAVAIVAAPDLAVVFGIFAVLVGLAVAASLLAG